MLTLPIKRKWFDMIESGEKLEEYRAMLAEMLEDMQRQERMECALRRLAEAMRASAAGFVIIAEAASHFADDLARDDAISELEKRIETQDAEATAYSENVPSLEELFRQLQEMACDRDKKYIRPPIEHDRIRAPRKISPRNARYALHSEIIRHRARDTLPN